MVNARRPLSTPGEGRRWAPTDGGDVLLDAGGCPTMPDTARRRRISRPTAARRWWNLPDTLKNFSSHLSGGSDSDISASGGLAGCPEGRRRRARSSG